MTMAQRGQWVLVFVIVGLLGGALAAGLAFSPTLTTVGVGSEAPDFRAARLPASDTVGLAQYRGGVVLLNIWATWCLPCEREMPSMERLHRELGPEGLTVVAVSVDNIGPEKVWAWVQQRELTFEILQDASGRIERTYQTTGVPESFVIDREGVIVKKVIGAAEWDHPQQKALFRRLLAQGS